MKPSSVFSSILAVLAGATGLPALARAAAPVSYARPALEAHERASIGARSTEALKLVDEAEAAWAAGRVSEAEALLARANGMVSRNAPLARRHCQSLLALGRPREAIAACDRAVAAGATARDYYTTVRALVDTPEVPTTEDLLRANLLAMAARRTGPREVWGPAAECLIALRWGDPVMIDGCQATLVEVAPEHEETRRILAAAAAGRSNWSVALGWSLLLAAVAGTLAHALRARRRGRDRATASTSLSAAMLIVLVGGGMSALPSRAWAQEPSNPKALSEHAIDDANPEASVPTPQQRDANPLQYGYFLQDLLARAEAATERRDHAAAVRYYRAVVKAVPDRAKGFSKLCEAYEAAGDRAKAAAACQLALSREGVVVDDFLRFVRLVLAKREALNDKEIEAAKGAIGHLQKQPEAALAGHHLQCELGTRLEDVTMLQACTGALAKVAPDDPKTISFQWALALKRGDRSEAQELIERARTAGVSGEGVKRMEAATEAMTSGWRAWLLDWRLRVGLLVVITALGGLALTRWRRGVAQRAV